MDKKEFFEKVAQMRQQQKAFFNAKPSSQERKDALIASKALEREIDQEIERVKAVLAKKDIYLIQYQDIDGTIASYLVEGFDIETQYRNGYMVANITKQIITYNGKDWEEIGSDFKAREGDWIGAKIGLFAISDIKKNDGGYVEIY